MPSLTTRLPGHLLLTLLALGPATAAARAEEDVRVTNFPQVQEVTGEVQLSGPTPQSVLVRFDEEIVAPVSREDTTALVKGGLLQTSGFVSVVLSLAGQVRADTYRPGKIGAVLIPEADPVTAAFHEAGQFLFPLEVEAPALATGALYISSVPQVQALAFPRYRIYFYNTTDRPATVTLFAYLTN